MACKGAGSTGGDGAIVSIDNNVSFSNYGACWLAVYNGSVLFAVDNNPFVYHDVTSLVTSRINQGYVNFGVKQTDNVQGDYVNVTPILTINYDLPLTIKADNNFSVAGGGDGQIIVDGTTIPQTQTPYPFIKNVGQTTILQAISPQTDAQLYQRIWSTAAPLVNSNWTAKNSNGDFPLPGTHTNINYTTVPLTNSYNGVTITANLLKVCNIPVQNNMVGLINAGTIIVNGTQYPSGTVFPVVEQNTISVTPQNQTINGIDYTFTNWSDDIHNHQSPRTFNPSVNTTISAKFVGKPNCNQAGMYGNSGKVGASPTVTWIDNVNPNVYYKVYTQTNTGGTWSSWNYICDVAKGVGVYVDPFHCIQSGKDYNFAIKIEAYYSSEGTAGIFGVCNFVGSETFKRNNGNNQITAIAEYKLFDNFPNPFNPSTEIKYQIPVDGNVKLKVYNMMGQEVMTLVNGFKEKGMYSVSFNAGNLASGLYIYKLEAGNYTQVKKMILTK